MKFFITFSLIILCATGCATSSDLAKRDQRIKELEARVAELAGRLETNEAVIRSGEIAMILKLVDDMKNEPVIQVDLIGEP